MKIILKTTAENLTVTDNTYRGLFCPVKDCRNLTYYEGEFCAEHEEIKKSVAVIETHPLALVPGLPILWWQIMKTADYDYLILIKGALKKLYCEKKDCGEYKYYRFKFCAEHIEGKNSELDDPNRPAFQPLCPPGEGTKV